MILLPAIIVVGVALVMVFVCFFGAMIVTPHDGQYIWFAAITDVSGVGRRERGGGGLGGPRKLMRLGFPLATRSTVFSSSFFVVYLLLFLCVLVQVVVYC